MRDRERDPLLADDLLPPVPVVLELKACLASRATFVQCRATCNWALRWLGHHRIIMTTYWQRFLEVVTSVDRM